MCFRGGGGEWAKIEFNYFCHCSSVVYLINKQSINGFGFSLYLCLQFCKFLLRLYCVLWVLCDSPGTREEGEIEQQPTDKLRGIQKVNLSKSSQPQSKIKERSYKRIMKIEFGEFTVTV